METRDAGFNIMLATDSYKVPSPPGFRGWGGEKEGVPLRKGLRDGSGGKVKVVSSPVPRPIQCNCILSLGLGGPKGAARKDGEERPGGGGCESNSNPALHPFVTRANTRVAGRHAIGQQPVLDRSC